MLPQIRRFLILLAVWTASLGTVASARPPVLLPDCEPPLLQQAYFVKQTGRYFYYQWLTVSQPGPSLGQKVENRFLDAAALRIYRGSDSQWKKTDIGTVGLFRGTQNGWLATGHGNALVRQLGQDTPLSPDQPAICLREDWIDLEPGDLVVLERLVQTDDDRMFDGLGKDGRDALAWKVAPGSQARVDLVYHDPVELGKNPKWDTCGQGCMQVTNQSRQKPAHVFQPMPAGFRPGRIAFMARAMGEDPVDLKITLAGKTVDSLRLDSRWREYSLALPAGENQAGEGIGLTLPASATVQLDDFSGGNHEGSAEGKLPEVFPGSLPAPAGVSIEGLLSNVRPTTLRLDRPSPALVSATSLTLPEYLARASARSRSTCVLELSPLHGEQDWLNLLEYLAAEFEPGSDLPILKPYGHRRAIHHGQARPWIDEFDRIEIRLIYRDPAAERVAKRVSADREEHIRQQVLPKSPYYQRAKDKLRFVGSNLNSPHGE